MKVVRFELPYYQNGRVLFKAGHPYASTEHTDGLIADGVAGEVSDITPEEAAQLADEATAAAEAAVSTAVELNALADASVQTPAT